ncbi:hypothetical protein AVEN_172516-1 [Araneus ventricosus]|uniref:Uncharacterized protein n=1 Tax=Araneus ventricosus TaxID=182803 RepID=A0A4Y2DSN9_ARAVE|nr:hypothetical protein AVEN_172516-1 [Araneus ventricosus]
MVPSIPPVYLHRGHGGYYCYFYSFNDKNRLVCTGPKGFLLEEKKRTEPPFAPSARVMVTKVSLDRCHLSNLFGTLCGNYLPWLLSRCHPSSVNAVDILSLEFESVVDRSKIGEGGYNIVFFKAVSYYRSFPRQETTVSPSMCP